MVECYDIMSTVIFHTELHKCSIIDIEKEKIMNFILFKKTLFDGFLFLSAISSFKFFYFYTCLWALILKYLLFVWCYYCFLLVWNNVFSAIVSSIPWVHVYNYFPWFSLHHIFDISIFRTSMYWGKNNFLFKP